MIKIDKIGTAEGCLEMRGASDLLIAETIIIMRTLAKQLESQTGTPADVHIMAMAEVATDNRLRDTFNKVVHKEPGVDLGSVLWKWESGDEP